MTRNSRGETVTRAVGAVVVASVGLVSAAVFVVDSFDSLGSTVGLLLTSYSLLFSATLVVGGGWLYWAADPPDRPLRVAGWCLAGVLPLLFTVWLLRLEFVGISGTNWPTATAYDVLHLAVVGGVAGFLLGVYDVRRLRQYREERRLRERLESVLSASVVPIIVLDTERRVQRWNDAAERLFGWRECEVLGEPLPFVADAAAFDRRLASEGSITAAAVTGRTRDGERVELRQSVTPIRDDDELVGHLVVAEDVTGWNRQQRDLERSHDLLERTQRLVDVGGWELDLDSQEVHWSAGTRELFGVSEEFDPTLDSAIDFFRPGDRDRLREAIERCCEDGVPYDLELRIVTAEGRDRWVRTLGEAVHDGDSRVALRGTIQDVTAQKRRDQQLMVLHRLFRHNLRNSLNVVIGKTDLLLESLDTTDAAREHLTTIRRRSEELVDIADKTSQFYDDSEQVEVRQRAVPATPVLERLLSRYRTRYPSARIELDCHDEVVFHGNPELLEMALGELLQNAIEHTDETPPVVELGTSPSSSSERAILYVADNGSGLSSYERDVVVTGNETPLYHGSGIGLWQVNWLVARLGGTVRFEDNDPHGTVAMLELPASEHRPRERPGQASPRARRAQD